MHLGIRDFIKIEMGVGSNYQVESNFSSPEI